MAVFRVERTRDYTVMSNHHLRNKELTLKAKGLLSQMLSLPEDWDYTLKGLAAINRESIDAIRTAVLELEQAGYIVRSRVRDERGCLRACDYIVYERPQEIYTITTADESVFYLVIDKQKTSENVYFLNTVTTDDLLPLAEQGKEPPKEVTPEPEPKPTEPVEEVPEPEPEKKDSPLLSLLLIGAVVLAGGGIGYYFKIYKPKHEAPDLEDDYCEYEDGELEEIAEEPEDEDTPPWEEDTEE